MKFIREFATLILVVLFTLIALDFFIKFSGVINPSINNYDYELGSVLKKNAHYIAFNEGFCITKTNNIGTYGPNVNLEESSNIIALMGDSYVESHQLFDRHQIRFIIENILKKSGCYRVNVLNFGRSGYNYHDIYSYYKNYVSLFNPNIVLIFVSISDFQDCKTSSYPSKTYTKNDSIIVENKYIKNNENKILYSLKIFKRNFSLPSLFKKVVMLMKRGNSLSILLDKFYINRSSKVIDENDYKICDYNKEFFRLSSLDRNFIFVSLDSESTIFLKRYDNCNVISVLPIINQLIDQGIDPYFWKATNKRGHWNHEAHKSIGMYLAEELQKIIKETEK